MSDAGASADGEGTRKRTGLTGRGCLLIVIGIILIVTVPTVVAIAIQRSQRPDVEVVYDSTPVSAACRISMNEAAQVEELNNDPELLATLDACANTDDWVEALKGNPGAGALTSYTTEDAEALLGMACAKALETRVCRDAKRDGRI